MAPPAPSKRLATRETEETGSGRAKRRPGRPAEESYRVESSPPGEAVQRDGSAAARSTNFLIPF